MVEAVLVMGSLAAAFGLLLGYAARRLRVDGDPVVERIDALLPQTQCGQCGYPGCRPYAEAIAAGAAEINRCPPGGEATIRALAQLLDRDAVALDPALAPAPESQSVARIDERRCIGCARCLEACPVDAIIGASRHMHTVVESLCTGCALCIAPCPVDCIRLEPIVPDPANWRYPAPSGGQAGR